MDTQEVRRWVLSVTRSLRLSQSKTLAELVIAAVCVGRVSYRKWQRMTIEELFRDGKNRRNGWGLRDTQLTRPDRIDRLLLILALAHLLLCGIGLAAHNEYDPSTWCSNTKSGTCSIFTIDRILVQESWFSVAQGFTAVINAPPTPH